MPLTCSKLTCMKYKSDSDALRSIIIIIIFIIIIISIIIISIIIIIIIIIIIFKQLCLKAGWLCLFKKQLHWSLTRWWKALRVNCRCHRFRCIALESYGAATSTSSTERSSAASGSIRWSRTGNQKIRRLFYCPLLLLCGRMVWNYDSKQDESCWFCFCNYIR